MWNLSLKGREFGNVNLFFVILGFCFMFRLVDIILEKMSDAPEDPSGQGNSAYGNQGGSYNKANTRLTVNDQQSKGGNQCQC